MSHSSSKARQNPQAKGKKFQSSNSKGSFGRTKLMCHECRAVYDGKSWQSFEKLNPKTIDELKISVCPACHESIDHLSDGVLHLTGTGMLANKKEIKNLIMNMAKQAEENNVLDRVERIDESQKNEMIVYTTKNQLAVRIAKKIAASHKGGKVDIKWSKDDKPVEVKWHYDLKNTSR